MNQETRTKNSTMNLLINAVYQVFVLIMTFLIRRVFIETLGIQYLGVSGLFTNILQVLSLAELGIGGAISFSMYKELAESNTERLQALNTYYKTLYCRIAFSVFLVGMAIFPFLKYIVNLEVEVEHVEWYYFIFLLDSVLSYLFAYKTTIVTADQKQYKLKRIIIVFDCLKFLLQILSLWICHSFLLYILAQVGCTLLSNMVRSYKTETWYPFIKEKRELEESKKKELWKNIKSMMYYKFGGVILNNTDNILISVLVSTEMVGYYSNYTMIYNKINFCINLFFTSIQASIGNLNVMADRKKKYQTYRTLRLINYWFFAFATIGIYFLAEDVILAMSGSAQYLLERAILLVGLASFYLTGICTVNWIYRETTGIFQKAKYSMLICSLLNIVLSILFGKWMGLFGILLATVVSRLLTNVWYEPYLLYKTVFQEKPREYAIDFIQKTLLCIGLIVIMTPILSCITIDHLYVRIAVKFVLCCIIPNLVFFVLFRKKEEFQYLWNKGKEIVLGLLQWMKERKQKSS